MQTVLEVKQVTKQYGQQYALDHVSLSIQKGDIYGLIGKNGAGKTTLLKTISRLIHANSGTVSVFGSQNSKEWNEALRKIGTVIETPVAYNQMTAYQNLNYYCKVHQIAKPDQLIKETLAYVGLSNTGKKKFRNFSLGMKQRLGIAIALISKPQLMILDEPINGLDPLGIKEFRLMIQRLNQELGITFIISSHILSELYLVALMIVDLLRNDMNRISQTGSERVERLCSVEQYSTVWQMTSTIKSQLQEEIGLAELFRALFPCGSITGAPKISTMAIIKATEKAARGVYCGTVGICLPDQRRIFNVAIRTIQLEGKKAIYGVGGGITWDSTWKSEYTETQQKSAVLYRKNPQFDLISTGRVTNGKLTLQDQHLQRQTEAAGYFAYPFDQDKLKQELEETCTQLDKGQDYRLRIALKKDGRIELETTPLLPLTETFRKAKLVEQTANLAQPFTYFKTSHRPHLTLEQQEQIYYNTQGQLLETSIGNLLLELDGKLYTPPAELGLLKGIYRQQLLDKGQATEKVLTLADLAQAEKIYACNAVRGLYELEIDKGEL